MEHMNCTKEKAQKLASMFGISQDIVDSFSYNNPVLPPVQEADADPKNMALAADRLRSLIERIERLEEERKSITSDIRDIFAEAKGAGFDVKIIRLILKDRKMNVADRKDRDLLLNTYRVALDM